MFNFMLQARFRRHDGVARVSELLEEEHLSRTPFVWACKREGPLPQQITQLENQISTAEILLMSENNRWRPNDCDQNDIRTPSLASDYRRVRNIQSIH